MRTIMAMLLLFLGMTYVGSAARAQADQESTNFLLPYCKEFVESNAPMPSTVDAQWQGFCAGMVVGISSVDTVCRPGGLTTSQMVGVVIAYIEARPARMHEHFMELTREALQAAWPCSPRR